jgi:hypothetical protein
MQSLQEVSCSKSGRRPRNLRAKHCSCRRYRRPPCLENDPQTTTELIPHPTSAKPSLLPGYTNVLVPSFHQSSSVYNSGQKRSIGIKCSVRETRDLPECAQRLRTPPSLISSALPCRLILTKATHRTDIGYLHNLCVSPSLFVPSAGNSDSRTKIGPYGFGPVVEYLNGRSGHFICLRNRHVKTSALNVHNTHCSVHVTLISSSFYMFSCAKCIS